jgi:glutathione S-transferase
MQLVGMLDSPYVRRVAISLQLLGLPFEHRSISVFRGFDEFSRINPVVKAPTLVCDADVGGSVLMDSTLIIDYAEALAAARHAPRASLMPAALAERQYTLQLVGLALAACEKSVQIIYERSLRPVEKQHAPWVARVQGQLDAALAALEAALARRPLACDSATIDQAGVSCAVMWFFVRALMPERVDAKLHPALQAHSERAERLIEFSRAPHGEGVVAP